MKSVRYELTGNVNMPAVVFTEKGQTPVWMQQRWKEGVFAEYIRNNGCGHCCTAMAARLYGVDIDPYGEYEYCRKLWGAPKELPNGEGQGHYLSAAGIAKVLESLGVPAKCYGTKEQGVEKAIRHIVCVLQEGKQVIFTSNPNDYPENPFSKGYHWVMAVGICENGKILVANSSEKAAPQGVQFVEPEVIQKALFKEATGRMSMTWGEVSNFYHSWGYIVVG